MKILITGNQGYLGPVVLAHLRAVFPYAHFTAIDTGYFKDNWTSEIRDVDTEAHVQIAADLRTLNPDVLAGAEVIIHLAAISNDPMGNQFEQVTFDINLESTLQLAAHAKRNGVKRFIFASSCSVYGIDDGTLKSEQSVVHPLTAYAKTKILAEQGLEQLASTEFQVTALRFATACGYSPRCRLDLVLNDFVASALTQSKIVLLSDGSPWRPLIHVRDMARAMAWAAERDLALPAFLAINAGSQQWNYRIRDLAEAVSRQLGGIPIQYNPGAAPDKRSYRVDFSLYEQWAPDHQPEWTLDQTVRELVKGLKPVLSEGVDFRSSHWIRLRQLALLIEQSLLDGRLHWILSNPQL